MARRGRKRKMAMAEDSWEKDKILPENLRDEMETMWELPQIYHFLQLTKEVFNVTHLSMYEVERMLLMPKASKQLAHIMTCLLSNPSTTKSKLHKVPLMPYTFWTNVLMYKLKNWFKIHQSKRENPLKTFDCLGVEPEFWKIFPDSNEIEGKDFQDFSFKQRVWLLKTVCDTAMHTRKTIQEEIMRQPSENQFETVLGTDRYGARYVYFPQFLHNDLRVYRHCLDNKVLSSVKPPAIKVKLKSPELVVKKEVPRPIASRGRRKRRRSRWQKGSLPLKVQKKPVKMKISCGPLVDQGVVDSSSNSADTGRTSRCSSKASELSASSCAKSSGYETNALDDVVDSKSEKGTSNTKDASEVENDNVKVEGKVSLRNEETKTEDVIDESLEDKPLDRSTNDVPKSEESSVKESSNFSMDDVSKSSKTDDEKLEEMIASKTLEKSEPDNKKCDTPTDVASECASDELSLDKWMKEKLEEKRKCKPDDTASDSEEVQISYSRRSARIKHISEIKLEVEDAENIVDMCETEELSSIDLRDSLCRVSSPEGDFYNEEFNENDWKVENFNELISDLSVSNFQLVADSLDSLKELIEYIASDKTTSNCESKETYVTLVCEVNLLQRMKKLVASLEKVESILKESTKKARNKLQREWSNFENGVAEEDQEQQQDGCDEGMSTNGWLVGPQGCNFERLLSAEKCSEMLSQPALSRDGTEIDSVDSSDPSSETPSSRQADQAGETQDETAATKKQDLEDTIKEKYRQEANGEEGEKDRDAQDKGRDEEEEREKTEEPEPRQTKRVLRARGVSSYTEQFSSDEESAEEQLDGWADIEAVYAPTSTPAGESAADNPPATVQRAATESYDDEDSEDSDQDWILPGSRKRKRKRSSASRRLKTFQNKIQNIQEHNAAEDNQSLHPSPDKAAIARQLSNRKSNQQISRNALNRSVASVPIGTAPTAVPGTGEGKVVKSEPQDPNLHSVLDIKDEGPIYDSAASSQPNVTVGVQPNYVVTTGQSPVANYYVMQQNPTAVVSQSQYIQSAAYVPQMMQTVQSQGYYVQSANPAQTYLVQAPSRPAYLSSTTPVVYQQVGGPQLISTQQSMIRGAPNYVQYVGAPMHPQQQQRLAQPRIINTTTLSPPRQIAYGARAPFYRMPGPVPIGQRPNFPHPPNGAVIRSAPLSSNVLRPGQRTGPPRIPGPRQVLRMPNPGSKKPVPVKGNLGRAQKNSSLIVISDSDDDIEMIIPGGSTSMLQSKQTAPPPKKSAIPPELLERMNEGGISLSPIKPAPQPAQQSNSSTQLVVVVNETGSHYALVLPNGSKLILTPDQVAQLRAANGGKLVL